MKNSTADLTPSEAQVGPEPLSALEVRRALSVILQSPPFRLSPQIQKVLKFVVLETLAGNGESLKERVIGSSLFDRPADYDTNADPIVRLRIGEVRKRLALYYQGAPDERVLISIPSGSFKAVFEPSGKGPVTEPHSVGGPPPIIAPALPEQSQTAASTAQTSSAGSKARKWRIVLAVSASSVLAVSLAAAFYLPSSEERAFNRFWSPVFENSNAVLIGMGNNPLYELSNAGEDEYYKTHPKDRFQAMGLHPYVPLAPGAVDSKYINPAVNTYLTIGDVWALSNVENVLTQHRRKPDIRFVNDMTYSDLRQNPTILIGVHNNIWTLNMMENLRYGFQGHSTIIDRSDPKRQWTANFDRSETYGVVVRIPNSGNGKAIVVIGGVGYSGTRTAGDFISDPQCIASMAKQLPKDWEAKNVEVVLHTTVKNQIPGPPDIVAAYAW